MSDVQDPSRRVTVRLPDPAPDKASIPASEQTLNRVTRILADPPVPAPSLGIESPPAPGVLVADRYLLEAGPLGPETGEAHLFRGRDLATGQLVALKFYQAHLSPKPEVLARLLNLDHPHLVCPRGHGRWAGRVYEVQEFCHGGSLDGLPPLSEDEVRRLIRPIIDGLKFCHDQGVTHRDLKPANILFRDAGRTELVISDFGISSFLPAGRSSQKTRTFMFFTLDYCCPEQLRLRTVGPPADYYALGVTAIHLLLGRSPMAGWSEDRIVEAHLAGQIPRPEDASPEFLQLIRGLSRMNPERRWGYRQVLAWLRREPILTDAGQPDRDQPEYAAHMAYPGCPSAQTPVELARRLREFDAAGELFRGRISLWVALFDRALAERVTRIETTLVGDPELALFRLAHTLDPDRPWELGGVVLNGPTELAQAIRQGSEAFRAELAQAFWDGYVSAWVAAVLPEPRSGELVERIETFRKKYVGRRQTGPWHLLFMLDPQAPLALAPGLSASSPEELADLIRDRPDVHEAAQAYLFSGQLGAWLELAFPERNGAPEFLDDCRIRYARDRNLGLLATQWYFRPESPLQVGRHLAPEPREVAALIEHDQAGREEGRRLLLSGRLRAWLTATGRLPDPEPFDQVMAAENFTLDVKLEMMLHLLDPDLPRPVLAADRNFIDLGDIEAGHMRSASLTFSNAGRGELSGRLSVEGAGRELTVNPPRISGRITEVLITARPPAWLTPGVVRKATLLAASNGGGLEIPVTYRVIHRVEIEEDPPPPEGPLDKFGRWVKARMDDLTYPEKKRR